MTSDPGPTRRLEGADNSQLPDRRSRPTGAKRRAFCNEGDLIARKRLQAADSHSPTEQCCQATSPSVYQSSPPDVAAFLADPTTYESAFRFALRRVRDAAWGIDEDNAHDAAGEIVQGAITSLLGPGKDSRPRYTRFQGQSSLLTWFLGVIANYVRRWRRERVKRRARESKGSDSGTAAKKAPPEGESETPWFVPDGEVAPDEPQFGEPSDPPPVPCRFCGAPIGNPGQLRSKHSACLAQARQDAIGSGALSAYQVFWLNEEDPHLNVAYPRWFRASSFEQGDAPPPPRIWRQYGRAVPYLTEMDEDRLVARCDLDRVLLPTLPDLVILAVRRYYVEEYEWKQIGVGPIEQVVQEYFQRCRTTKRGHSEPRFTQAFTIACRNEDDLPATSAQVWARVLDAPAGEPGSLSGNEGLITLGCGTDPAEPRQSRVGRAGTGPNAHFH